MTKNVFNIKVYYDSENVEVNKIKIEGGFKQPSLEMTDLISDVIGLLSEKQEKNWSGYIKEIK